MSTSTRLRAGIAFLIAAALVALALNVPTGPPAPVADDAQLSVREECQRALSYPARTQADITWLKQCVHALTPPTPTPTTTTRTPTPTKTATPTPPPTTVPPGPSACPPFPAFPDAKCTGWVHTGVTLHTCDGSIEASNVKLDSCYFPSGLKVIGRNVTVTRSHIRGTVSPHWSNDYDYRGLMMVDVEIEEKANLNPDRSAVWNGSNYTCIRCHVHHTGTGMHMGDHTRIVDSYVHDFTYTAGAHQAAVGSGQGSGDNSVLLHNNLDCSRWNVPPGPQGCSSALSLYDEPTLNDVLVQQNLFNTAGGYCTYAGGPRGTNIRYINNRFGKKYYATCGLYGAVAAWYPNNTGNRWEGNLWHDGSGSL